MIQSANGKQLTYGDRGEPVNAREIKILWGVCHESY